MLLLAPLGLLALVASKKRPVMRGELHETSERSTFKPYEPARAVAGPRARVVSTALAAVENPPTPDQVWADTAPELRGTDAAWCGGFVLWVLHRAGLARDVGWTPGKGFCYLLPQVTAPELGDVAYFHTPYQHHAIVVSRANGQIGTVDGNQPGVRRRVRELGDASAYYSIAPFLEPSAPRVIA